MPSRRTERGYRFVSTKAWLLAPLVRMTRTVSGRPAFVSASRLESPTRADRTQAPAGPDSNPNTPSPPEPIALQSVVLFPCEGPRAQANAGAGTGSRYLAEAVG